MLTSKAKFSSAINTVFSVTSSFRNNYNMWPLDHKTSLKWHRYICSNRLLEQYIVWVKIVDFSFIGYKIKITFHEDILSFPTINIYIFIFLLVICIAKNFIWTTLKTIFSIYLDFFAPSDSRFSNSCISAIYCPILTNHTSTETHSLISHQGKLSWQHRIESSLQHFLNLFSKSFQELSSIYYE